MRSPRFLELQPRYVLALTLMCLVGGVLLLVLGSGPSADVAGLLAGLTGLAFVVELVLPAARSVAAVAWLTVGAVLLFGGLRAASWAGGPENAPVVLVLGAVGLAVLWFVWPRWWAMWWLPYQEARLELVERRRSTRRTRGRP